MDNMNRKLAVLLLTVAVIGLSEAATVARVVVRQQWPWNKSVRVDFRLTDVTEAVDIAITASAGGAPLDCTRLSAKAVGDRFGLSEAGDYSFTFDPAECFPAGRGVIDDFTLTLTPVVSGAGLGEKLYKVIELSGASFAVRDITVADLLNGAYGAVSVPGGTVAPGQSVDPAAVVWTGVADNRKYAVDCLVLRKVFAKGVKWQKGKTGDSTQYDVTLTNDFYIGVFEFTQGQWNKVMGAYPTSAFSLAEVRDARPVDSVSYDAIRGSATKNFYPNPPPSGSILQVLSEKTGLTFELPYESQWEFACRSGYENGYWGNGVPEDAKTEDSALPGRHQYNGGYVKSGESSWTAPTAETAPTMGSENGTALVGTYEPNKWGLYDMYGNVGEMCVDWNETNVTGFGGAPNVDLQDPSKTLSGADGENRTARGGGYNSAPSAVRSYTPRIALPTGRGFLYYGFRVCVTLP